MRRGLTNDDIPKIFVRAYHAHSFLCTRNARAHGGDGAQEDFSHLSGSLKLKLKNNFQITYRFLGEEHRYMFRMLQWSTLASKALLSKRKRKRLTKFHCRSFWRGCVFSFGGI